MTEAPKHTIWYRKDDGTWQEFTFIGEMTIGKAAECDLVIDEEIFSSRHTTLSARPDGKIRVTTCYSTRDLPDGVVVRYDIHGPDGALLEEMRITGDCDLEYDSLRLLPDGRAVVLRNYEAAMRAARSMVEEGDEAREDATFEVIVCDLVEVS